MYKTYEVNGTKISIIHLKEYHSQMAPYMDNIVELSAKNFLFRKFRKVGVLFHINDKFDKNDDEGIKEALKNNELGFVLTSDVAKRKNAVHIREDAIYWSKFTSYEKKYPGFEKNSGLRTQFIVDVIKEISGVIVHEITHLWHLRINDVKKVMKKNSSRIKNAYKSMIRNKELFFGNKDLGKSWFYLRENLLLVIEYVIKEGIANFVEYMQTQEFGFTAESLRKSYAEGYKQADCLNRDLGNLYAKFIAMLRRLNSLDSKSFEKEMDALLKELQESLKETRNYGYGIGAHVYHMILYVYEDMAVEDLADFSYEKIIMLYEEASEKMGWTPIITLDRDGVFSYKNHLKMLTALRKETERFT